MKPSTLMVCKGLIGSQEALATYLPPSDQHIFAAIPTPAPLQKEHLKWDLLQHIHYSWLAPHLRTLSQSEIPLFLAALSETQANGLMKVLGFGNHLPELTKVGKGALRKILLDHVLQGQELTPMAFLPDNPYNRLLTLTQPQLHNLVRFLGLHDLSFEMRQIIATKELKRIFAALSKKEGEYVQSLMLNQEPLVFKRLFLQKWDGTKEMLQKLVDERGLQRLGAALHGMSDSFHWYFTHRLEMHQGNLLTKYREKPSHPRGEAFLKKQIEKILQEVA